METTPPVAIEVAEEAIENWLKYKKATDNQRIAHKEAIERLVAAVSAGVLIVHEDNSLSQKLYEPVGDAVKVTELKFKNRIRESEVIKEMKGVSSDDNIGMTFAYAAAVTGESKGNLKQLVTEDSRIMKAIVLFFL